MAKTKKCPTCGKRIKKPKHSGLASYCKTCRKKYTQPHKEKWNRTRREKHKIDPRKEILRCARYRAKRDGYTFSLSIDDIKVPEYCPVLGIPLYTSNGYANDNSPTLDKIAGVLGYQSNNVRVISWRANRLKSDATVEELLKIVDYMKGEHA